MELRDHIIIVLHQHGIIRMSKPAKYLAEIVKVYLTDSDDLLLSKLLRDTARRRGIRLSTLYGALRTLASRMGRKDPAWYEGVFSKGYSAPVLIRAISRETLTLCGPFGPVPHRIGKGGPCQGPAAGGIFMQATGTLSVRVYTSQAQIPLEGATVVVAAPAAESKWKLLSIQNTNSSGMIRPVTIDAPALGESTSPGGLPGDGGPFAVCDVWAEQPGYAMLQIENVQIFPGVETMQDMELTPLPQGLCSLQQRDERDIPAQGL